LTGLTVIVSGCGCHTMQHSKQLWVWSFVLLVFMDHFHVN